MTMQLPKPAASLSSALLARKGAARPGQRYIQDMSFAEPLRTADTAEMMTVQREAFVAEFPDITQNHIANDAHDVDQLIEPVDVSVNDVDTEPFVFATKAPITKAYVETAALPDTMLMPKQRLAPGQKARSAFTLRLDPERHLKLRLIAAHKHRSAQSIVVEALDRFLAACGENETVQSTGACVCRTPTAS